jgi:hypothetical protein
MLDEREQPNHEVQVAQDITEDLPPADETAATVTGGDTSPAATVSNIQNAYESSHKSVADNLR